jgi:hypothetical protein
MSSQSRDLAKVKVKSLDEPVDCISRFVGKDLDQIISSEFTSRFLGVGKATNQFVGRSAVCVGWTYNLAAVSGMPRS